MIFSVSLKGEILKGVIRLGYIYENIPVNSQIYFWGIYISQNQLT